MIVIYHVTVTIQCSGKLHNPMYEVIRIRIHAYWRQKNNISYRWYPPMDPEQITGANRLDDFKCPDDFCVGLVTYM